jgi:multimeric flavodoxin WrbA
MMKIVVFLTVPRKESSSIILKQMKIVMNNNRNREVKLILANPLKISKKG